MAHGSNGINFEKYLKWLIFFCLVAIVVKLVSDFVVFEYTDVTPMLNLDKEDLERTLDVSLEQSQDMLRKIYIYTDGEVTVDSDSKKGIALVYIDGKQAGLHIDDSRYSMYGLQIGGSAVNVHKKMSYEYEDNFKMLEDMINGSSTAHFFRNHTKGDCLVIIANDMTNRIVAMTYYRDGKKATEQVLK